MSKVSVQDLLCCPACGGELSAEWLCRGCGRAFTGRAGIPDLRWPLERDDERTRLTVDAMLAAFDRASYDELCRERLARFASSAGLEQHYLQYRLHDAQRGAHMTTMIRAQAGQHYALAGRAAALDLGCGSGAAALTMRQDYGRVVALDYSLPDLILLNKKLAVDGIDNVVPIQGNFLNLPLADGRLDYVVAVNVIEHMFDVQRGFAEVARVLRSAGCFAGDSRNRFDLLFPEPHVRLRCVGCLPRRWASPYVQWRRGRPYNTARLLSYWELQRTLAAHFSSSRILFPRVAAYRARTRAGRAFEYLDARLPALARLILPFFPTFIAVGCK